MMKNKVTFERKLAIRGDSQGINIPIELLNFLEADAGDQLRLCGEHGKHGRYITIWKKKQE